MSQRRPPQEIVMTFTVGAIEFDRRRRSGFQEFISIAKGRSIVSAADWGPDRLELGLSGGVMIRLFTGGEASPNPLWYSHETW